MLVPLTDAVPHSVSTVINFKSMAPVIESPLSMTTVVVASSADAKRIPATSESGMLAVPKDVCICNCVVSVSVPSMTALMVKATVTDSGRGVGDGLASRMGFALVGNAFMGSGFVGNALGGAS